MEYVDRLSVTAKKSRRELIGVLIHETIMNLDRTGHTRYGD